MNLDTVMQSNLFRILYISGSMFSIGNSVENKDTMIPALWNLYPGIFLSLKKLPFLGKVTRT